MSGLPHRSGPAMRDAFAALTLVLPSRFTGGAIRSSYNNLVSTYECWQEARSFSTSAIAWYTDAVHSLEPVTSGYIGGSVLAKLLEHPKFSSFNVTAIVRDEKKAEKLRALGIKTAVGKPSMF